MVTQPVPRTATSQYSFLLFAAWLGTLLASPLPEILWRVLFAGKVLAFFEMRVVALLALCFLTLIWPRMGPLRSYIGLLLVLTAVLAGFSPASCSERSLAELVRCRRHGVILVQSR